MYVFMYNRSLKWESNLIAKQEGESSSDIEGEYEGDDDPKNAFIQILPYRYDPPGSVELSEKSKEDASPRSDVDSTTAPAGMFIFI
jgi:hypothetical protein